ncbi:MAG: hypothetical protein IJ960_07260 [Oscillospiraceae bacterium]|nr:hypothetical protein [Oscillospiraceae bacterium]
MEKLTMKEKLAKLWKTLSPALSYRSKPGCPTCMTPVMNENGIPEVAHCSRWEEKEEE